MRNIILIFAFLTLLSCKEKEFSSFTVRDINEIAETIIIGESLFVSKNDNSSRSFCTDLIKINIRIPIKSEENPNLPPPLPFNNVSINELLNFKTGKERFFLSTDSTYLILQNLGQKEFKIEQNIIDKINSTTIEKEILKQKIGEKYNFYDMTIPIFSKDNSKAYVELNHHCGAFCGEGKAFFLSKTNGKWRIIYKYIKWVS